MRSKVTNLIGAVLLTMPLLAVGVAQAQTSQRVKVDVPFAFHAGDKELPAGTYIVAMNIQNHTANLTTGDGEGEVFMVATTVGDSAGTDTKVVFDRMGNSYFFEDVETPDLAMTFTVKTPRVDMQL